MSKGNFDMFQQFFSASQRAKKNIPPIIKPTKNQAAAEISSRKIAEERSAYKFNVERPPRISAKEESSSRQRLNFSAEMKLNLEGIQNNFQHPTRIKSDRLDFSRKDPDYSNKNLLKTEQDNILNLRKNRFTPKKNFIMNDKLTPSILVEKKLFFAVKNMNSRDIDLILRKKVDPKEFLNLTVDQKGDTVGHYAAWLNMSKVVSFLIAHDANVNIKNKNGFTPLMLASFKGHVDILQLLSGVVAEINLQDEEGNTALHYAVLRKSKSSMLALLRNPDIEIDIKNREGETAFDVASPNEAKILSEFRLKRQDFLEDLVELEFGDDTWSSNVIDFKAEMGKGVNKLQPIKSTVQGILENNERLFSSRDILFGENYATNNAKTLKYGKNKLLQTATKPSNFLNGPLSDRELSSKALNLPSSKFIEKNEIFKKALKIPKNVEIDLVARGVKQMCQTERGKIFKDKKLAPLSPSKIYRLTATRKADQAGLTQHNHLANLEKFSKTKPSGTLSVYSHKNLSVKALNSKFKELALPCKINIEKNELKSQHLLNFDVSTHEQNVPQLKDFIIHSIIGRGSFGDVYLVQRRYNSKRLYAMKVLDKGRIKKDNLSRYVSTERKVMALIKHPFITRLKFAFQNDSFLFLVMDYYPGGNLAEHLKKQGCFSEEKSKIYTAEILLAIEELHKRDIIYRDLKPENVVLDEKGHALLIDFGLSKEGVTRSISETKSFCGSCAYLAPEMLHKKGHGKALDWYLLGIILFEFLTGRPPFYCEDKDELFYNIENATVDIPPGMSAEVTDLLERLLEKNPILRLGALQGASEVKEHPWFRDIDFDLVLRRKAKVEEPNLKKLSLNKLNGEALFQKSCSALKKNSLKDWTFVGNSESFFFSDSEA